ncbi:hypothetical protein N8I77_013108 [Diaporthe amygdali]|uniref:Uncharacterized protein n=1 Tax=Phomopsis amygdali TaxID=1214568 RepID=A0AAD9S584_PHOAM|nr:hypothetical protein N8I77_013108 [Diaporthe amygdali]
MAPTLTTDDANVLNRQAMRGDTNELAKAVDRLAAREAAQGVGKAEILLRTKDDAGNNVVHAACIMGNADIIAFVCGHEAFNFQPGMLKSILNAKNNNSETPIHVAIKHNQPACVDPLLQNGAELNAEGPFGFRVAHISADRGYLDLLRMVLQRGANPNAVSRSGDTPAHVAARKGYLGCLKVLFYEFQADLRAYNMANMRPANIAENNSYEEIMVWMREAGLF